MSARSYRGSTAHLFTEPVTGEWRLAIRRDVDDVTLAYHRFGFDRVPPLQHRIDILHMLGWTPASAFGLAWSWVELGIADESKLPSLRASIPVTEAPRPINFDRITVEAFQ